MVLKSFFYIFSRGYQSIFLSSVHFLVHQEMPKSKQASPSQLGLFSHTKTWWQMWSCVHLSIDHKSRCMRIFGKTLH